MKQKSVPDVSIFAFDQRNGRSFSMDSELEDEFEGLMSSSAARNALAAAGGASRNNAVSTNNRSRTPKNGVGGGGGVGGVKQPEPTSLAMRPKMEDVVDNLESWFPNHDLDQPVGDPGASTATTLTTSSSQQADQLLRQQQRKADGRKSIRMIAKEQVHGDPLGRRRTRLWNSSVKELKQQP
ncbi:hypothetical protein H1R20_g8154, partial [Candolleomyces eurysporus]